MSNYRIETYNDAGELVEEKELDSLIGVRVFVEQEMLSKLYHREFVTVLIINQRSESSQ